MLFALRGYFGPTPGGGPGAPPGGSPRGTTHPMRKQGDTRNGNPQAARLEWGGRFLHVEKENAPAVLRLCPGESGPRGGRGCPPGSAQPMKRTRCKCPYFQNVWTVLWTQKCDVSPGRHDFFIWEWTCFFARAKKALCPGERLPGWGEGMPPGFEGTSHQAPQRTGNHGLPQHLARHMPAPDNDGRHGATRRHGPDGQPAKSTRLFKLFEQPRKHRTTRLRAG